MPLTAEMVPAEQWREMVDVFMPPEQISDLMYPEYPHVWPMDYMPPDLFWPEYDDGGGAAYAAMRFHSHRMSR